MISKASGTLDINDQKALDRLESELVSFREHMHLHADLEEKLIHPLLSERVPGGDNRLNEDHLVIHRHFDELIACFREIKKKPNDFEKRELSLEFYLAWSRFTSFYFNHIDYEEENAVSSLSRLCTNDELTNTFKQILADQTPKELMDNLAMSLCSLIKGPIGINS